MPPAPESWPQAGSQRSHHPRQLFPLSRAIRRMISASSPGRHGQECRCLSSCAERQHRLDRWADRRHCLQFLGYVLKFIDRGTTASAQVPAERRERQVLSDHMAMSHRVDHAPGRVVDGNVLSGGEWEVLAAEVERVGGVLGHHNRWIGKQWAMTAACHSDVHSRRYVVDEFVKSKSGFSADDRARHTRTHSKQIKMRGLRSARLAIDPSRQLVKLPFRYQKSKVAGRDASTTCLSRGKGGRQGHQPCLERPSFPRPHVSNSTHQSGRGAEFDTSRCAVPSDTGLPRSGPRSAVRGAEGVGAGRGRSRVRACGLGSR